MNDFIPDYLLKEFSLYRAGKILGMSPREAYWLDEAEIYRACSFSAAEGMATARANYKP